MLPREPACPAALAITGASASQQGVICRIMQRDQAEDPGVGMNPRQLEVLRDGADDEAGAGGVYLNLKSDANTVVGFCHGRALPVLTDDDGQGRASFTYCPTWQQRRNRDLAGAHAMFDPVEPEPVSMGVSTLDAPDPWAAARAGLDELAPLEGSRGAH